MSRQLTALQRFPLLKASPIDPAIGEQYENSADRLARINAFDPYLDYSRSLTAEGGILIAFRDYDLRFRHAFWGGLAWSLFTWLEIYTLVVNAVLFETWGLYCCALALGLTNWLIVSKPVEIYRRLEIRPDCMIVDGDEVFWARNMEHGWPTLEIKAEEEYTFQGVYGSRSVEFFTVRRFDKNDRTPELFASHFKDAVEQLWKL